MANRVTNCVCMCVVCVCDLNIHVCVCVCIYICLYVYTFQALQKLDWRQHRYVWLTQGWYQDKWWKAGSDGFGGGTICSDDDLLEFLRQQRVLGVSHYPTPSDRTTPTTFGIVMSLLIDIQVKLL